jgi:hypothetical protein
MLESVARGIDRLEAVTKRIDPNTMEDILAKLQAPPLGAITDIKTLRRVVVGLEELAGTNQQHPAKRLPSPIPRRVLGTLSGEDFPRKYHLRIWFFDNHPMLWPRIGEPLNLRRKPHFYAPR